MQFPIKICALSLIIASLTACGGSDGDGKTTTSSSLSSSSPASTPIPSSSSSAPASQSSVSSSMLSSSSSSSVTSEQIGGATNHTGFSVAEIEHCGVDISAANKTYSIFSDYDVNVQSQSLSNFGNWNHVTNGSTTEWTNLKHSASAYNFITPATVSDSCNGVDTINIVLVKKIADWDHQHANGFEKNIKVDGKKFSDVESLVLDLKINSEKTFIPTLASLKDVYSPTYVNEAKIDALDSGKVNIGIVIYGGKTDPALSASRIIEIDQTTLAGKWLRVTLPIKDLKFCSTVNYYCNPISLADLSSTIIEGIQFVGETKSGAVLRGDISSWSTSVPETFKEIDVTIKKIEFQLK